MLPPRRVAIFREICYTVACKAICAAHWARICLPPPSPAPSRGIRSPVGAVQTPEHSHAPERKDPMPFSREKMLRPGDLFLLLAFVLMAALLAVLVWTLRAPGGQVVVRVDGQVTATLSLGEDQTYEIETPEGGTNLLVIHQGTAWLEDANCPDRLCVRQGKIRYAGDSIICLPHLLVVEITGGQDGLDLDAVAG